MDGLKFPHGLLSVGRSHSINARRNANWGRAVTNGHVYASSLEHYNIELQYLVWNVGLDEYIVMTGMRNASDGSCIVVLTQVFI